MTKDELIQFLKDNLRLQVETVDEECGYPEYTSVSISIDGQKINEIQLQSGLVLFY